MNESYQKWWLFLYIEEYFNFFFESAEISKNNYNSLNHNRIHFEIMIKLNYSDMTDI